MPLVYSNSEWNWKRFFKFYWEFYKELVVMIPLGICYLWCVLATFGKGGDAIEKTLKEIIKDNKRK